jgi:predicted SnoaL-like aldol condensation-catalyzing enzyme
MVGPTELINKDEVKAMSQTIQERNKALVLEAFDTLFNKRDYVAAERYWSPKYVQHSAHIAPGREGPLQPHQELADDAEIRAWAARG